MTRKPEPAGFSVIDCTGISIGNSDIEASSVQGDVRPEDVRPGTTPLPGDEIEEVKATITPFRAKRPFDYLSHYEPVPEAGCWIWLGEMASGGYGRIYVDRGRREAAHRVFYREMVGEIPDGMCVCHKCDTRCCVNPSHLFIGSLRDNAIDMSKKGRSMYGERNSRSKLTKDAVREILHGGQSKTTLAEKFGVSRGLIGHVRRGRSWRKVAAEISKAQPSDMPQPFISREPREGAEL